MDLDSMLRVELLGETALRFWGKCTMHLWAGLSAQHTVQATSLLYVHTFLLQC